MDWGAIIKAGRKLVPTDIVDVTKLGLWWAGNGPGAREAKAFVRQVQEREKRKARQRIAAAFAAGYLLGRNK